MRDYLNVSYARRRTVVSCSSQINNCAAKASRQEHGAGGHRSDSVFGPDSVHQVVLEAPELCGRFNASNEHRTVGIVTIS